MDDFAPGTSLILPPQRKLWDTSCRDWEDRILSGRSLVPDLPLFQSEADWALSCFKRLRIPDVIGMPRMGDAARAWVFDIVAAIFGSYDATLDIRMVQEFFLLVPKKNSKSSSAAAIMVVALIVNRRPSAEYVLVAPTIEVASIAFRQAAGIIRADKALSELFHLQSNIRRITHRVSGATLQIKAADADVITGGKQVGTLIDETHVFADHHDASDVFVEIRGALAARLDGFLIQITTQSKKPPAGVFKDELSTARRVRDGQIKLPLLPILYELPTRITQNGGWKNERYWPLVNPNMGLSVSADFLRGEIVKLEDSRDAAKTAVIASQHFNVEIGLSLRSDRWAGADYWLAAADPELTLETLIARSEVIAIGIDGGGLDDLLAIGVMGRDASTKEWLFWTHAWAHPIVLERRKEIAPSIADFVKVGDCTMVASVTEGVSQIGDIVERIENEGLLAEKEAIGLDTMIIGQLVDEITGRGIDKERIYGIPQNWQLTAAIHTSAVMIHEKKLRHCGQDLMRWAVGNVKIEPRGNAVTVTKQVSGTAKIDPYIAMLNGVVLMSKNPTAGGGRSVYDVLAKTGPKSGPTTDSVGAEEIDVDILANPSHPDWHIHRERWERKNLKDDDDGRGWR